MNVVSSPDIYTNEWASFSTKSFPTNWHARPGDIVRTIILDAGNDRPVDDVFWPDESYQDVYRRAELTVAATYRPLACGDEPYRWVSETRLAPWVIYVMRRAHLR